MKTKFEASTILLACASVAAGSRSCGSVCERAKEELINYSTSEESLAIQRRNILNYCRANGDIDIVVSCRTFVPEFWEAISLKLWPEAWSHLCDDIEKTCESGPRLTCRECELRIDLVLEKLRDPIVTDYWVQKLREGNFCFKNYSGLERLCDEYLQDLFPELLLINTENDWVPPFCSDFGCNGGQA